jgi:hypothetical protein
MGGERVEVAVISSTSPPLRNLGTWFGPHDTVRHRALGGRPYAHVPLLPSHAKAAPKAYGKLRAMEELMVSKAYTGADHISHFHSGPRSSLTWGRSLLWGIFWEAEWRIYTTAARHITGIRVCDRVPTPVLFAEAGLRPRHRPRERSGVIPRSRAHAPTHSARPHRSRM